MSNDKLHAQLVLYGKMLYNLETREHNGFRRVRVFELNSKKYVHHMFNGEVIEIVAI